MLVDWLVVTAVVVATVVVAVEEEGARGARRGEREKRKNSLLSLPHRFPFSSLPSRLQSYSSRTIAFFSRLATVSVGCAPTASHFLMAGALRLVSFLSGS